MKTSSAGIALLKNFEGCKLVAYQDIVGVWTIGYGDTLDVRPGMTITQQQAEDGLMRRLGNEFEPGVLNALDGAPVTQAQFDALVNLAWNIGVGRIDNPHTAANEGTGLKGSSVIRLHRAGEYLAAANAFLLWNRAGGQYNAALAHRREVERALYLLEAPPAPVEPPEPFPGTIDADLLSAAIEVVQRIVGVDPDGIFGPITRAAIEAAQRGT